MNTSAHTDAIAVTDLVVRRGRHTAIDRLSCRITAGQVTGVLGPSGSGKSTLLRSIVGVQKVASGTVHVLDRPAGDPSLRSEIGYQTQGNSVYTDLSVRENVAFFAALAGAPATNIDKVVTETGLDGKQQQLTGDLSGGQQSRVNLACALVGDPRLLVLDEPTVGQDPVLREELWDGIHRRAAAGATVLVSSHVMEEAARCDRLLLIHDGRLLAEGTPAEIMRSADAPDMDQAFLALVRRTDRGAA